MLEDVCYNLKRMQFFGHKQIFPPDVCVGFSKLLVGGDSLKVTVAKVQGKREVMERRLFKLDKLEN